MSIQDLKARIKKLMKLSEQGKGEITFNDGTTITTDGEALLQALCDAIETERGHKKENKLLQKFIESEPVSWDEVALGSMPALIRCFLYSSMV